MFTLKDRDLNARIGSLKIRGKKIETPYLFPVINPFQTELEPKEIQKVGFKALITNAYILFKKKFNDNVHKLLDCEIVMTDSGGYQILEYKEIDVTNREIVEYQIKIDTDIGVFLDVPTGISNYERAKETVEETIKRAKEAKEIIDKIRLWAYPIQGGIYKDLVKYSAEKGKELDFDVYALGSPTVLMTEYNYLPVFENLALVRKIIEFDKPLHLFGAGHSHLLPFAIALGADLFDSASYILFARDERYMTSERTYSLKELDYFPCNCTVCSKYEPKELLEMNKKERTKLLALHNLYVLKKELNAAKQAIREGRFWEYLVQKSYSHPKLREAFEKIAEQKVFKGYLFKPKQKALFLFSSFDLKNPKVSLAKERAKNLWKAEKNVLLLPYHIFKEEKEKLEKFIDRSYEIYLYSPYFGIIKESIAYSFPFFQSETNKNFDENLIENLSKEINEFIKLNFNKKIKIIIPKGLKLKIKRERNVQIIYFKFS
ncbi:MAG: tRNA guanosine(15) transglycosylase TgtA [Candidatus Aenigmatarchaeota archaeon]